MARVLGPEEGWPAIEKFVPEANIAETEKAVEVTLELPGMKPEEIHIELHDGELWITGEKKEEKEEKGKTFHRIERRAGAFRRVLPMPAAVEEAKVEAAYNNGVLRITLPKTVEARRKEIPVKG
jgi:HSP20 family protein